MRGTEVQQNFNTKNHKDSFRHLLNYVRRKTLIFRITIGKDFKFSYLFLGAPDSEETFFVAVQVRLSYPFEIQLLAYY
jgi:hypothetical protein